MTDHADGTPTVEYIRYRIPAERTEEMQQYSAALAGSRGTAT